MFYYIWLRIAFRNEICIQVSQLLADEWRGYWDWYPYFQGTFYTVSSVKIQIVAHFEQ